MTFFVKPLIAPDATGSELPPRLWHTMSVPLVAAELNTDPKAGLTADEVVARREQFGPNELRETPPTPFWVRLLEQFKSFVILILKTTRCA